MSATVTHRVTCADHTQDLASLNAAQGYLCDVETAGNCRNLHTIEVLTGAEWLPLHIARARAILAASIGASVETLDGPLFKHTAGWSRETADKAEQIADPAVDFAAWRAAIGLHEHATLSQDGKGVRVDGWCKCAAGRAEDAAETWVRYERWTAEGRLAHGYVCPFCRFVTQVG